MTTPAPKRPRPTAQNAIGHFAVARRRKPTEAKTAAPESTEKGTTADRPSLKPRAR